MVAKPEVDYALRTSAMLLFYILQKGIAEQKMCIF
jgi:hypothetical protein